MDSKSQKEGIRKLLERGETITNRRAIELFNCYRLSARIKDLRDEGKNLVTDMVYGRDEETGKLTKYARYRLAV